MIRMQEISGHITRSVRIDQSWFYIRIETCHDHIAMLNWTSKLNTTNKAREEGQFAWFPLSDANCARPTLHYLIQWIAQLILQISIFSISRGNWFCTIWCNWVMKVRFQFWIGPRNFPMQDHWLTAECRVNALLPISVPSCTNLTKQMKLIWNFFPNRWHSNASHSSSIWTKTQGWFPCTLKIRFRYKSGPYIMRWVTIRWIAFRWSAFL